MRIISKKIPMQTSGMKFDHDHWPIVHVSMEADSHMEFYGTDTQEDFLNNLRTQPEDWIYKNKNISYDFNSDGLRMNKNLEELDSEYFIAFGCSHTLGVGIAESETWPALLSSITGIDYINAGVAGSSIKLAAINFFNMLSKNNTLPRAVAFAWPSSIRTCFYENGEFLFCLPRFTPEEFPKIDDAYKKMLQTDILKNEAVFYRNMVMSTCKRLNITYAEISFDDRDDFALSLDVPIIESDNKDINYYYARDLRSYDNGELFGHIGIGLHMMAAKKILETWNSIQ
jgi:hypothetical protein